MSAKEAQGFLDAILDEPDNDDHRLIFADWLDENGSPQRAEFIRIQIERASLPWWDARQIRLRLREEELLESHAESWKMHLPTNKGVMWGNFRRGFVGEVGFADLSTFFTTAGECWTSTPLESATIQGMRGRELLDKFEPIPELRELTFLSGLFNHNQIRGLANASLLSTLRSLTVSRCPLGSEGFSILTTSPHLDSLKALRVPGSSVGNAGIEALCEAKGLGSLEELDLTGIDGYDQYNEDISLGEHGIEALADWPGLAQIRSLNLQDNVIGRVGLQTLLHSGHVGGLKTLILRNARLLSEALAEFPDADSELELEVLDLGGNLFQGHGPVDLLHSDCLRDLKVLKLDHCEIDRFGSEDLTKAPFRGSLHHLDVTSNYFDAQWLRDLMEGRPEKLHTLLMHDNNLSDEGVEALAKSPATKAIQELELSLNNLSDTSLTTLMGSKNLTNLRVLRIGHNDFTAWKIDEMEQSELFKRLTIFDAAPTPAPWGNEDEIPF